MPVKYEYLPGYGPADFREILEGSVPFFDNEGNFKSTTLREAIKRSEFQQNMLERRVHRFVTEKIQSLDSETINEGYLLLVQYKRFLKFVSRMEDVIKTFHTMLKEYNSNLEESPLYNFFLWNEDEIQLYLIFILRLSVYFSRKINSDKELEIISETLKSA